LRRLLDGEVVGVDDGVARLLSVECIGFVQERSESASALLRGRAGRLPGA
jgi:hypothetical protein